MKIAIVTGLSAKRDMEIHTGHCVKITVASRCQDEKRMIRVQYADGSVKTIAFSEAGNQVSIDGNNYPFDRLSLDKTHMHLIHKGASRNVEIISVDRDAKIIHVRVNGYDYPIQIREAMDELLTRLGMSGSGVKKQQEVRAPMPGMVIQILVNSGQEVVKDEPLLILEAMKMENVIKSPVAGTIKRVGATKGTAVEKNSILLEFE